MLSFLLRRVAQMLPLLVLVSLVVFALIHAAPGGPLALYLDNPNVRPQDIERLRRQLGLDRPLTEQYFAWAWAFVRGEWGYSYADGRPVMDRLLERVPATLQLAGLSSLVAVVLSLIAGVVSAVRRGVDRAVTAGAIAGISLPVFWLGLVLQLVFANQLGWFPLAGRSSFAGGGFADRLAHLVLPVIALAAATAAGWSRYLRSSMREALAQPFIDAARARGVREGQLVSRHALRYALLPFVTVVLLDASLMVSGAVVTESVFAWPGVGSLFTESLAKRDYTVLMAFLMCGAITVALLSLASDVVVRALDPRLRDAA